TRSRSFTRRQRYFSHPDIQIAPPFGRGYSRKGPTSSRNRSHMTNSPKRCATFSIRRVTADASAEFDHYRRSAGNYVSRTFRIPDRGTEVRALGHSHRRRVRIRYRGNQSYIECFSFFQYAPRGLSADLVILTKPFAQLRRVS